MRMDTWEKKMLRVGIEAMAAKPEMVGWKDSGRVHFDVEGS